MAANMQDVNGWISQHPFLGFAMLTWLFAWKGLALWKAARKNDLVWFIVLFLVNLLSVLEILYYFVFSERRHVREKK